MNQDPTLPAESPLQLWQRERDRLRTLLVLVVLVFWGTIAFQVFLYYLHDGKLNFVLLSIIGGMMTWRFNTTPSRSRKWAHGW